MHEKIYYDDSQTAYESHDVSQYTNKFVKVIIVNKKDLYQFDRFMERLMKANCHDVKVIDFSDMSVDTVSDDIIQYAEDTTTLINKYVDELPIDLDKDRLKRMMRGLYNEAQDLKFD